MKVINYNNQITIYPAEKSVLGDSPTKINIASIGSVTIEEVEQLILDLQEVISIAKSLK